MEWKCFTCEHLNGPNLSECEACGAVRNLHAEEAFENRGLIKKLEAQIKTLKRDLIKTKNENDKLTNQITEKVFELDNLSSESNDKFLELLLLKNTENDLRKSIKAKGAEIIDLTTKLNLITKASNEKDGIIRDKEGRLKTKESSLAIQSVEIQNLKKKLSVRQFDRYLATIFILISVCLLGYIFYFPRYNSNLKLDYITQTNLAFTNYIKSNQTDCGKENLGARTVLVHDLNNDKKLDGIVIATFNGLNCKNSFETILYVYNLKNKFINPPISLSLSKSNESYLSFRGVENGKLVFDKWLLKDFDGKKLDSEKIKNAHLRLYISLNNDSLIFTTL
ncbi:MAG: hypothetical protein QM535_19365 [Limnohabitans sp.]|nr:hypothetical protein [Limnohabitans sp.]